MRLIVIHSFVHDASMLIVSRNVFIIISLSKSKKDNPWIRVARTGIAGTSHWRKNLRQNSRPGILLPGPRLNSSPFFVSRSARGWHSSPSPDLPTYHGFLLTRSSSVCSPKAKSGSPRVARRSRSPLVLSTGTSFARFSFRRGAFPLSSIVSK